MKYLDFRKRVNTAIFTPQQAQNVGATYTPSQLTTWQNHGYITKLRGGLYAFTENLPELSPTVLAPHLVRPSYISLEYALGQHGIIPEAVFTITSVTTKTTRSYQIPHGTFLYRHLPPHLFFGYTQIKSSSLPYYLAEKEKALLDFLYLSPHINNRNDLEELRLNVDALDWGKVDRYANVFGRNRINHLLKLLRKVYAHT